MTSGTWGYKIKLFQFNIKMQGRDSSNLNTYQNVGQQMNCLSLIQVKVRQLSHFVPENDQICECLAGRDRHGGNGLILRQDPEQRASLQVPKADRGVLAARSKFGPMVQEKELSDPALG